MNSIISTIVNWIGLLTLWVVVLTFIVLVKVCYGGESIYEVTRKELEPVPPKTAPLELLLPAPVVTYPTPYDPPVPKAPSNTTKSRVGSYRPAYSAIGGHTVDTTIDHLVRDHGENLDFVKSLTPEERNRLHGKHHPQPVPVRSNCANGQCGMPQQFFRRRR